MALKEVEKLEEEKVAQQFQELKQHILECIEFEEFQNLTSYDITKIKELHARRSVLFWKNKIGEIQKSMDEIKNDNPMNYEFTIDYCKLAIEKYECYNEQKKAEARLNGTEYSYNAHHKPVIENQIMQLRMRMGTIKRLENSKEPKKVEVIP